MKHTLYLIIIYLTSYSMTIGQEIIPFDTVHWDIQAQGHVFENFHGKDAVYIKQGMAILKDAEFLNGTIEFDIFLTDRRSFPGIRFRVLDGNNNESFYFRNHQSGNVDANQGTPEFNGLAGWQLYFGPRYSFQYDYNFDVWTHVKIVVSGDKAQIFLDNADKPNLTWKLKNKQEAGGIMLGGGLAPMHYANFKVDPSQYTLVDVKEIEHEKMEGIISRWAVSDKFDEKLLDNIDNIKGLIDTRKWLGTIDIEENNAINISRLVSRPTRESNTAMVKIEIDADEAGTHLFNFGYSDRVVLILNGEPIYRGNNGFRTRDYRYLGTIGLFDAAYLNLKKGNNTLVAAVSENFGGWGFMGRILDQEGLSISAGQ